MTTSQMKASDFSTEVFVDDPRRIDEKTVSVLVGVPFGYELDQVKMFPQCTVTEDGTQSVHTGRGYRLRFRRTDGTKIVLENAIDGSLIEVELNE